MSLTLPESLRPNARVRCRSCRLQINLCVCEEISPVELTTRVTLLIHYKEFHLASNTGHLLGKKLQNSQILIWGGKNKTPFDPSGLLHQDYENVVLFPLGATNVLQSEKKQKNSKPLHLIVPDGNWQQASKLIRHEKFFHSLRKVALPASGQPSRYRLRQAPHAGQVCTFEAVSRALGILENQIIQTEMEKFFEKTIRRILWSRGRLTSQEFLRDELPTTIYE